MSHVETIEKNKVKLTFEVAPDRFEEGLQYSYNRNRGKISIPGFRKGRAPRKIIEVQYGKEIFYEDAINFVLPEAYEAAIKETETKTVSKPEIDVEDVSAEKGVVFTAEVFIKPDVEIDGYYALTYKPFDTSVSDDEVNARIDTDREKNARLVSVERPVAQNDTVVIDFEGFMDGEAFEGGKGEDHELVIGSHSFIDTFEDQIIGHAVGDTFDVNVSFPEEYGAAELAGKPAVFTVTVKEVREKELPEANDDFAQDVSEFDTLDELKEDIRKKLEHDKEHSAEHDKEDQVMEQLIEKAVMDVPQVMIDLKIDDMVRSFQNQITQQGLTMDMYLQYMGQTREGLRTAYAANAESQVKGRLALEAVAAKEQMEVTEEDVMEEIAKMAEMYKMETEKLASLMRDEDKEGMKDDLLVQKALQFVLEKAVAMA